MENPYAAPQASLAEPARPRGRREPPLPVLSKLLTLGLWLNVAMVPLGLLIGSFDRRLWGFDVSGFVAQLATVAYDWLLFGWPVTSAVALLYTQTFDRRTHRWLSKSWAAGILLLLWVMIGGTSIAISILSAPARVITP